MKPEPETEKKTVCERTLHAHFLQAMHTIPDQRVKRFIMTEKEECASSGMQCI